MSGGSGLVLLFHKMGEHDGHLGSWAFHKGGNGGFTQVLARAAQAFGAEIELERPCRPGADPRRPGDRGGAGRRHRADRAGRGLGARRASYVPRAGRPARAARRSCRQRPSHPLPRRRRRRSTSPSTGCPSSPAMPGSAAPFGGFLNIGPTHRVPRARLRRRQVRLVLRAPVHRRSHAVGDRPRHGTARQARAVLLRPVRAVRAQGQGGDWETERETVRRQGPGRARGALPGVRQAGAAARGRHAGRHRATSPA